MQKRITFVLLLMMSCLFSAFSPLSRYKPLVSLDIKQGDTLHIGDRVSPRGKIKEAFYKRGAYDKSRYFLHTDSTGFVRVSELKAARGHHQNQIDIYHVTGNFTRTEDTVFFNAFSVYDSLYLIDIKNKTLHGFGPEIRIAILAQTPAGTYCPLRFEIDEHSNITALPEGVSYKEVFKHFHAPGTYGVFKHLSVRDPQGNMRHYPEGDFVLIGGNRGRMR